MEARLLLKVVVLIGITAVTVGVRITSLYVPGGASHDVNLICQYDLEGSALYDVKWYKDGQQFFRCQANGSTQVYPVEGVKVYHDYLMMLGKCSLTLTGLSSDSAGEYKCEVTTEGPLFNTAVESRKFRFISVSPRIQNETDKSNGKSAGLRLQGCSMAANILIIFLHCYCVNIK